MTTQYRVVWRSKSKQHNTIWYQSEDDADRMAESLRRNGIEVIRFERRSINPTTKE